MSGSLCPALLDSMLEDHEVRANIDGTLETLRALGLEPRPDVIRQQAALHEIEPDRVELLVALIARRLACVVAAP